MVYKISTQVFNSLTADVQQNFTTYWTGLTNAISASSGWVNSQTISSASQAEALGRTMANLASDYARGLTALADGSQGTEFERTMLRNNAAIVTSAIENMRASSSIAYEQYGRNIALAAKEGGRATLAKSRGVIYSIFILF